MTEEIYIDGVNVAGCEFAVKPKNDNRIKCHCAKGLLQIAKMQEQPESIKSGLCENNPDCYYKQLKRAEIEIEKLKGVDGSVHPDSAYYKITRLEQENKELKETIQELNKSVQDCNIQRTRLYKALEEIKEIIRADCKGCTAECDCDDDCTRYKIQNKINEALGC